MNLSHRLNIWKTNIDFINKHNSKFVQGLLSFEVGMNQFGDLTNKEFVKMYNGFNWIYFAYEYGMSGQSAGTPCLRFQRLMSAR